MRLSEAIRLGSMMRPQGFGYFLKDGRTCAFGAAYEAIGVEFNQMGALNPVFDWAHEVETCCPECEMPEYAAIIVTHLNDFHRWTRERIADFVATVEPPEEVASDARQATNVAYRTDASLKVLELQK